MLLLGLGALVGQGLFEHAFWQARGSFGHAFCSTVRYFHAFC